MQISSLHIHPIKSCRILDVEQMSFDQRGPVGDRRFLLVDEKRRFLTQRTHSNLARIEATLLNDGCLNLKFESQQLSIHLHEFFGRANCRIWRDEVELVIAPEWVNNELSNWCGRKIKLAFQDHEADRKLSSSWALPNQQVSLADAHQVLIANTASLEALNTHLVQKAQSDIAAVPMSRFRPNIVIDSKEAWIEDSWKRIRISGNEGFVELQLLKPCDRCVVTTRDQMTGEATNKEPLQLLMKMRKSTHADLKGPMFGWNCAILLQNGKVTVGDSVEVLESREEAWPFAPY